MSKRSEFAAPATITRGQAPAGTEVGPGATKYVDHQPPAPPAPPAADVTPIQKARNQKLAQIEAKVAAMKKTEQELAEQQKNADSLIAQMKAERQALLLEKESLERDVIRMQQDLAAEEARQLAAQALQDQVARGESQQVPLHEWREQFKEALLPLTGRIVAGLAKLRALLAAKGATLEQVAALRVPEGLDAQTWSEYRAISIAAGEALRDLHLSVRQHERALAEAEGFIPDPRSVDGRSAIAGLRYQLEDLSGIVLNRLVDLPSSRIIAPSAGIEGHTNASVSMTERVASLLTQYAQVQKRANQVVRPEIVITLKPKPEKPRHEVMSEQRGPAPVQIEAEGVN